MARYAFACASGHETIINHPMEAAGLPDRVLCECGRVACRVYGFHFQEDRTRLFKNPVDGSRFSYALGELMPDNRRDYQRLLDEKGCEPVTPATMPEPWKENQQYREHVMNGGDRDPKFETAPSAPPVKTKTVLQQLRESNVRIPS